MRPAGRHDHHAHVSRGFGELPFRAWALQIAFEDALRPTNFFLMSLTQSFIHPQRQCFEVLRRDGTMRPAQVKHGSSYLANQWVLPMPVWAINKPQERFHVFRADAIKLIDQPLTEIRE